MPGRPRILSDRGTGPVLVPTISISREERPPFPPLTTELLPVFAEFMASDEATRPPAGGSRQKLPLRGDYVCYQPAHGFRASDKTQRIYVSVRAYEELGETNQEACRAVAVLWEQRIGSSRRGRPRTTPRARDFLDTVQTVRSLYNDVRSYHPLAASRPERDLLYETWLGQFWVWYRSVASLLLRALLEGHSGRTFAEELQEQPDTAHYYRALARVTKLSLWTILDTVVREHRWPVDVIPKLSRTNIEQFIPQFLEEIPLAARSSGPASTGAVPELQRSRGLPKERERD